VDEFTEQAMREEMEAMGMDEFSIDAAIEAAYAAHAGDWRQFIETE
jgi:hypothetical protein